MFPQEITRQNCGKTAKGPVPAFSCLAGEQASQRIPARRPSTRNELCRRVFRARAFILNNWGQPLSVEEVARQANLSVYHFHRTFRQCFGLPPGRFIKRVKMQKACQLLETEGTSVTEVAYQLGFSDLSTFSKAFKREMGVSPSALTRKQRQLP